MDLVDITNVLFDRYSRTVLVTLVYCIIVYYLGWLKIFHLDNKKRTTSGALFLGGAYLNVEHLAFWHRWDIDHFGHEQIGICMIILFIIIRVYVIIKKKQIRYLNPFYSEDFLAKHYYSKYKVTRWNIEKIGETLSRANVPENDAVRFVVKIEDIVKKKPEDVDQNLEFTQQIRKQKSRAINSIRSHKEKEFLNRIQLKLTR